MGLAGYFQGAVIATPFFNDAVTTVVDLNGDTAGLIAPTVLYMHLVNTTAATAYLQIFKNSAANVTLGTTAPDWTIRLNANESRDITVPWSLGGEGKQAGASLAALSIAGTTTATGAVTAAISVQALSALLY